MAKYVMILNGGTLSNDSGKNVLTIDQITDILTTLGRDELTVDDEDVTVAELIEMCTGEEVEVSGGDLAEMGDDFVTLRIDKLEE